jgi:predicted transcriptional regulator
MITIQDVHKVYQQVQDPGARLAIKFLLIECLSLQERAVLDILFAEDGGVTSRDVAKRMDMLPQNASRALKNLCEYDLARREKEGKVYKYFS